MRQFCAGNNRQAGTLWAIVQAVVLIAIFPVWAAAETEGLLFVPNQYAPLSKFQQKTTTTSTTLTFSIHPSVAQYISTKKYLARIAYQSETGIITLASPSSFNAQTGVLTLITNKVGRYVVVSDPFVNDFPIVTHWRQSLNSGRGGFSIGGSDSMGVIDFDPTTKFVMRSDDLFDKDPASPYTYNTTKYALFSSDPLAPNAKTPSYNRYVGENYTINKITDRMAVYLSLQAIESTGYPMLHRNHPTAFNAATTNNYRVREGLPALQVIHAFINAPEADKPSLATFILPPLWTKTAATGYPILFNGFYDLHENFTLVSGIDFSKIICDLMKRGIGSSIGVIWNGGGALGPLGIEPGLYHNVAVLFENTKNLFKGDTMKVVTSGISRGGATALSVAANPFFDNYKVKYAISHTPAVRFGEHINEWINTTYPGTYAAQATTSGYKYAYKPSFIESVTNRNGTQVTLFNITSSTLPSIVDEFSPSADIFINKFKERGTSVLLQFGTNDSFMPFPMQLAYYNKLRAAGVPTELHIGYRFGHTTFTQKIAQITWAMEQLMTNKNIPYSGIHHYRRSGEDNLGAQIAVKFTPTAPLWAELPKLVYTNQRVKVSVSGGPGITFALAYAKIDDALFEKSQITVSGELQTLMFGAFNTTEPLQSQTLEITVPSTLATGRYTYLLAYSTDQGQSWQISDFAKVPQLSAMRFPIFEVRAQELTSPAMNIFEQLDGSQRGWGLSNY